MVVANQIQLSVLLGPRQLLTHQCFLETGLQRELGRDTRDVQGSYSLDMELWIVVVAQDRSDPVLAEQKLYKIISIVTNILSKNKRYVDPTMLDNPLAARSHYEVFPFVMGDLTQQDIKAKNIVAFPTVGISLR